MPTGYKKLWRPENWKIGLTQFMRHVRWWSGSFMLTPAAMTRRTSQTPQPTLLGLEGMRLSSVPVISGLFWVSSLKLRKRHSFPTGPHSLSCLMSSHLSSWRIWNKCWSCLDIFRSWMQKRRLCFCWDPLWRPWLEFGRSLCKILWFRALTSLK